MESIPEGVTYDDNSTFSPSTFETWQSLLKNARSSVDIASFYWTLSNQDTHTHDPSASQVRGGAQKSQTLISREGESHIWRRDQAQGQVLHPVAQQMVHRPGQRWVLSLIQSS